MRQYLKFIAGVFLIPITRWYLRKERHFSYDGINVTIVPTVFHPGFFGSTKFVLDHLRIQDITNRAFLELGCGSGLISIFAARKGARVTASDLNPAAIANTKSNAALNLVSIAVIESDLFTKINAQIFDWIVINPPYYPKQPVNAEHLAWYCGEDHLYFRNLFKQLGAYIHRQTSVIMILSLACDIAKIKEIAAKAGFEFTLIREGSAFFEAKNFLFAIQNKI